MRQLNRALLAALLFGFGSFSFAAGQNTPILEAIDTEDEDDDEDPCEEQETSEYRLLLCNIGVGGNSPPLDPPPDDDTPCPVGMCAPGVGREGLTLTPMEYEETVSELIIELRGAETLAALQAQPIE
mgnify:CR=1 FL=1